jgi:hypothetical protein
MQNEKLKSYEQNYPVYDLELVVDIYIFVKIRRYYLVSRVHQEL